MSVWAYVCESCDDPEKNYFVSADTVSQFPPGVTIVQVKDGAEWHFARLSTDVRVEVDGMLLHDVIPAQAET